MQLTQHTEYALRVLIYLSLQEKEKRCNISEIADCFSLSRNHLVKIVHKLSKEGFIETYTQMTAINRDLLMEKVRIRQPLVSLHWVLWAAIKLCDFRSQHTVSELVEAHQQRVHRFEAVACHENIEKISDTVS